MTAGMGAEMGRGGQRGKNWDNYNRITIKMILKKQLASLNSLVF